MKFSIRSVMKSVAALVAGGALLDANAGPLLPTAGGNLFSKVVIWMQNYVDFLTGPFATAAVIVSALLVWVAWAIMPKEGIIANMARIVVAGFAIMNIGVFCSTFV